MSKTKNITIAGAAFRCSPQATRKLRRILLFGKVMRPYRNYDSDIAEACRDLLMEHSSRAGYVSDRHVAETLALVAPSSPFKLAVVLQTVSTQVRLAPHLVRSVWSRHHEVIVRSLLLLVAAVLCVNAVAYMQSWLQTGFGQTYQAEFYGTVHEAAQSSTIITFYVQLGSSFILVTLCLLALRYRRLRIIVPIALIAAWIISFSFSMLIPSPTTGDYALACGGQILTDINMPGSKHFGVASGTWRLAAAATGPFLDSETNCNEYATVMTTHPGSTVVIAQYVMTASGHPRAFDALIDSPTAIRYGFFVPA